MKFIKIVYLFILLALANCVYGQHTQAGLHFYAHDRNIDKRTSLVLNNGDSYKLNSQDKFTLDFDIYLRNETIKFGYIFRIIANKEENFDFLINNEPGMFFVINNQDFKLKSIPFTEKWNHVSLSFDKKQNTIFLRFNDEIMDCPHDLKSTRSLHISFGQCEFKNFLANDVSPFILKNVRISNNSKEIHHWALGKHSENVVYDELKNQPALAHNPHWLMDNRIYWKKATELTTEHFPQLTFDSISNKILILNKKELISYSPVTHTTESLPTLSAMPSNEFYNRLLFNPLSGKLLYYGFDPAKRIFYDFDKNVWTDYQFSDEEADYAHHNRYISPADSALYLFGGYGHYKYNSAFVRVNLKTNERTTTDLSNIIMPRYLAAMGGNKTGDKIYILGGRGAEMGRQELSPKNFSDLYEYDLKTRKVKYLFDTSPKEEDGNVYSNSLIMHGDSIFYVLTYPNNKYSSAITLKKVNIHTQKVEALADTIDFYFRDITAFCDLYFSPSLSKLIAVTAHSEDRKTSQVNIYTLDFPPLQVSDVIQKEPVNSRKTFTYIVLTALFLVICCRIWGLKLKSGRKKAFIPVPYQAKAGENDIQKNKPFYDFTTKSVLFLGGFQVFDKEGKNITGEFTPTLKHLLVLIVLYTFKNNKGISSSKLQELLWFDKMEEAARNNRSVNVRKLRVLLQELGDVDITNQNGYWTIALPDDILLDYKEILRLTQTIQQENVTKNEDLLRLLELLNYGILLPNIQLEWIDHFKNDFSNAIIDTLMHIVNNNRNSFFDNPDIQLKIADCILKIDLINEEALAIKCKAFCQMGKKGLAKTAFDNFTKEYKLLLGEAYPGEMKDFMN